MKERWTWDLDDNPIHAEDPPHEGGPFAKFIRKTKKRG